MSRRREALYIDDLTVQFGAFVAIDGLSLTVDYGEIRAIIGPNGAGKTTLLDVLTGKTSPRRGRVLFDGTVDLTRLTEPQIALGGLGRKFQKPSVFEALTVADNVALALRQYPCALWKELILGRRAAKEEAIAATLATVQLQDRAKTLAGTLSHGQKQWLEIGMLLIQQPRVLMLDEPVAGMSDEETTRTVELVRQLKSPDRAVLVIEHDMEFVERVADKVTVLHEGRLLYEGDMAGVKSDPQVQRVYLGRQHAA
ncbi:MAG: urea ABC transporter ATP-binding protein UrtD [Candidatus Competibacterales bacterium]